MFSLIWAQILLFGASCSQDSLIWGQGSLISVQNSLIWRQESLIWCQATPKIITLQ